MKKTGLKCVLALLILALPILIFANVWFAFQSYKLEEQVNDLQDQQFELIERNKRLITGVSVLRSPSRIIEEARKLGMTTPDTEQIIVIQDDF